MSDLIIHLGLSKTASTFLQQEVFGGKIFTMDRAVDAATDKVHRIEFAELFLKNSPAVWRGRGRELLRSYYGNGGETDIILSHESLYEQNPFRPVGKEHRMKCEPYLLASRLREINEYGWPNGDVKALLFIRQQHEWLPSIYSEGCFDLPRPSQSDFEARVGVFLNPDEGVSHVLEYDLLYDVLARELGAENVLMLPYEVLREAETWDLINDFISGHEFSVEDVLSKKRQNVKKSRSRSDAQWSNADSSRLKAMASVPLFKKAYHSFLKGSKVFDVALERYLSAKSLAIRMPEGMKADVQARYRASNLRCSEMIGYELVGLGY